MCLLEIELRVLEGFSVFCQVVFVEYIVESIRNQSSVLMERLFLKKMIEFTTHMGLMIMVLLFAIPSTGIIIEWPFCTVIRRRLGSQTVYKFLKMLKIKAVNLQKYSESKSELMVPGVFVKTV